MQITEREVKLESNFFSAERDVTRTAGLHLSHVISFILAQETKPRTESDEERNDSLQRYAVGGFVWERVLANLIERQPEDLWDWMFSRALNEPENPAVVRPGEQCIDIGECPLCAGRGEICVDGQSDNAEPMFLTCSGCNGKGRILVFMTPDGYHIPNACLEEWKYTSKSFKGGITGPKFKRWVQFQIPAYLKVLNLQKCRLRVYFSRGDYGTTTILPTWREYMIEYTPQEIDDIWDCIVLNALYMVENGLVDHTAH